MYVRIYIYMFMFIFTSWFMLVCVCVCKCCCVCVSYVSLKITVHPCFRLCVIDFVCMCGGVSMYV